MRANASPLKDEAKLRSAANGAASQREILDRLGLRPAGGNFKSLKEALAFFGIPLPTRQPQTYTKLSTKHDDEIFVENSTYLNGTNLKKRLFAIGVPNQCSICGQLPEWNGLPLTLQLDHINGVHNDNRRENLRIVCGHCHSQTSTFAGRNTTVDRPKNLCADCGKEIWVKSVRCVRCSNRYKKINPSTGQRTTVMYPPYEELRELVNTLGYTGAGKVLGTSDNAVRKHLKKQESQTPIV